MALLKSPIDEAVGFLAPFELFLVPFGLETRKASNMVLASHWFGLDVTSHAREGHFLGSGERGAVHLEDYHVRYGAVVFGLCPDFGEQQVRRGVEGGT